VATYHREEVKAHVESNREKERRVKGAGAGVGNVIR